MKRAISLFLAVLLIAALFTACSSSPAGSYGLKTINGQTVKEYYTAAAEAQGIDLDTLLSNVGVDLTHPEDLMKFNLKSDGTLDYKLNMGEAKEGTGTWKMDGDKLILTVDGDDKEVTLKDGQMTIELGSSKNPMTIVLGK